MRTRKQSQVALAALALAAATPLAAHAAVVSTFTGGDPGEGLDLQGNFAPGYAVYVGPQDELATYQVQDAAFVNADLPYGIDVNGVNNTAFGTPDYGFTSNDDNLEQVMNYVRYGNGAAGFGVYIDAPVVPGQLYRLQLMFNEACCDRGFDVVIEGTNEVDDFNPGRTQGGGGGPAPQNVGALITHDFVAGDNNLDIELLPGTPFLDNNAIIDAVSLELVPEPGSLGLLVFGGLGLLARRRRGR